MLGRHFFKERDDLGKAAHLAGVGKPNLRSKPDISWPWRRT
jgi:hypothetical protein